MGNTRQGLVNTLLITPYLVSLGRVWLP